MSDGQRKESNEKKFFSIEEVNNLIPLLEKKVILLQEIKQKYDIKTAQHYDLKRVKAQKGEASSRRADIFFILEVEIEFMQIEIQSIIRSIEYRGALLKDVDMGLIDFPAIIHGEERLLCWKLGEEKVQYYHELNEGYYHRKPIC